MLYVSKTAYLICWFQLYGVEWFCFLSFLSKCQNLVFHIAVGRYWFLFVFKRDFSCLVGLYLRKAKKKKAVYQLGNSTCSELWDYLQSHMLIFRLEKLISKYCYWFQLPKSRSKWLPWWNRITNIINVSRSWSDLLVFPLASFLSDSGLCRPNVVSWF